jgi:hypothetical protein
MRATSFEKGQALSEFLILAFALIPLFLLLPVIAKYQDISHSTQMASRYVAFDATTRNEFTSTWKSETQMADEVRRRYFSNSDAPIKTNDVAGNFLAHQNLFWRDPKGAPLIKDFGADVKVSYGLDNKPKPNQGLSDKTKEAYLFEGFSFEGLDVMNLRSMMNLPDSARVYTGNVSVTLANLPAGIKSYEPFDKINLSMNRSTSLVVEPWMANSPHQAEDRFGNLAVVDKGLKILEPVLETVIYGLKDDISGGLLPQLPGLELRTFHGPKFGQLDSWRDVVPVDRLK